MTEKRVILAEMSDGVWEIPISVIVKIEKLIIKNGLIFLYPYLILILMMKSR
jgi:hypothetical protein